MKKPRLGISTCLLGEEVRYNGGHKLDRFITETLGQYVEFVPVCPEVECGMSIPREAMRLVGDPANPKLMTSRTNRDMTPMMSRWIPVKLRELEKADLDGYIFKAKSPSSGMERVKVYNGRGGLSGRAPGMFAKAFMDRFPLLPVEDDGRLNDPDLRENFIERIFTLRRYREAVSGRRKAGGLVKFQSENKLLIMSHSPALLKELGRLTASGKGDIKDLACYEELLLKALKLQATPAKHVNVLQHIMGYFKKMLSADEKQELLDIIGAYRAGNIPLIVPVTLLNHYVKKYGIEYLAGQSYLHPHPLELKLRNHA